MRRVTLALLAATALLAGCGGGAAGSEEASETTSPAKTTSSAEASRKAAASARRLEQNRSAAAASSSSAAASSAAATMSPEDEARFVTSVTANVFNQNREALSTQLVKSRSLVEAQTDFRFDEPTRTLVVAVTSIFKTGGSGVPYSLATGFAPVFWGPEATTNARPESLALFSVTVDATTFVCDGPTMVSLAKRELSEAMFAESCAA